MVKLKQRENGQSHHKRGAANWYKKYKSGRILTEWKWMKAKRLSNTRILDEGYKKADTTNRGEFGKFKEREKNMKELKISRIKTIQTTSF